MSFPAISGDKNKRKVSWKGLSLYLESYILRSTVVFLLISGAVSCLSSCTCWYLSKSLIHNGIFLFRDPFGVKTTTSIFVGRLCGIWCWEYSSTFSRFSMRILILIVSNLGTRVGFLFFFMINCNNINIWISRIVVRRQSCIIYHHQILQLRFYIIISNERM